MRPGSGRSVCSTCVLAVCVVLLLPALGAWAEDELTQGHKVAQDVKKSEGVGPVLNVVNDKRYSWHPASVAIGNYLASNQYSPEILSALRAYVARPGMLGKGSVMIALSPNRTKILDALVTKSRSKSDHLLAAHAIAAYAFMISEERRTQAYLKAKGDKLKAITLPSDLGPYLRSLLDNKNASKETIELVILAAAYLQDAGLAEAIGGRKSLSSEAKACRLFYDASIGNKVDPTQVRRLLGSFKAPDKRYTKAGARLGSYNIRGEPLLYASATAGLMAEPELTPALGKLLKHRDLRVQIEAARALGRSGDPAAPALLRKKLVEKDLDWPVKIAVLWALGENPDTESIEFLQGYFGKEKGRLRQDVIYALASITQGKAGLSIWEIGAWLKKNKPTVDRAATLKFRQSHWARDMDVEGLAGFYGSKILSDRFSFVLDTSKSMEGSKIVNLKANVDQTLEALPEHVRLNIVDFGGAHPRAPPLRSDRCQEPQSHPQRGQGLRPVVHDAEF